MKRILKEVSAADMRGPLDKLHELLADKQLGAYWLHQLVLMMRKEPTHTLTPKWLNDLSSRWPWNRAEEHFLKTQQLWYNEPQWPFQICVLEIGGLTNEKLFNKYKRQIVFGSLNTEKDMINEIKNINLFPSSEKRKIFLIRLQTRFLNLPEKATFSEVSCNHPQLNLSLCPPETAFFMRPLVKEYFDSKATIFAMNFKPSTMVDKNKKRVFYFNKPSRGYSNDLYMGACDIFKDSESEPGTYWIFQYNFGSTII